MTFKSLKLNWKVLALSVVILIAAFFVGKGIYSLVMHMLYPIDYTEYVEKYAEEYEVEPALVYAVINSESSFDSDATSHADAKGLMQITPETFEWLQTKTDEEETLDSEALYDPEIAIKYGTLLLSLHLKEFGDVKVAMAAYHAGRSCVNRWLDDPEVSSDGKTLDYIPYDSTSEYVHRVVRTIGIYQRLYHV